jgi:hypothetical protein
VAVLLAAVVVVVVKTPTADAAARPHARVHGHAHAAVIAARRAAQVQVPPGLSRSPNWSGYVAYPNYGYDSSFNEVSAEWTQAAVTCPKKNAWTLFWVGFDGWSATPLTTVDRSVEQGGTSAQCVNGVPHYSAFYEMWPTHAVMPMFSVQPGDQIAANVVYADNQFLITVTDTTSNQTSTQAETCATDLACPRTSAEWIAESPSHFGTDNWFPLADFGTMDFTDATTTNTEGVSGPIADAQWQDLGIERIAGHRAAQARVTALENAGGTSTFADSWDRR